MNEPLQPIPFTASKPLDLDKIAQEAPGPVRVSLPEYNQRTNTVACVNCGRGGHTRTPLLAIIKSVATMEYGYACKEHVGHYIRPKDVSLHRKS